MPSFAGKWEEEHFSIFRQQEGVKSGYRQAVADMLIQSKHEYIEQIVENEVKRES